MNLKEVIWSKEQYQEFIKYLKSIKEDKYREFSMKLTPTKYEILGIRIPKLRSIAKDIFKGNYQEFLILCGNEYFEEDKYNINDGFPVLKWENEKIKK